MQNNSNQIKSSAASLLELFLNSRKHSLELIKDLSPEDCQSQSMEDASPAKWHLAHVTWFYEVMVLKAFEKNFQFWNSQFAILFNSYYNGVGDKHPRHQRGLLTRPTLAEVLEWRINVENRVCALLNDNPSSELQWLIRLGVNHEQQHQELLLTDIQHLFSCNTLLPAYSLRPPTQSSVQDSSNWIEGVSGLVEVGYNGENFHFDNEAPMHRAFNQIHHISSQLITNAQWILFMKDGGYHQPHWWLDAGWAWLQTQNIEAPLYWIKEGDNTYTCFSLYGNLPVNPNEPISHISYFEADAFSRWASKNLKGYEGARLPTEFEWESFASTQSNVAKDLFGKVWQWTSSHYSPYPGYQPWGGVAGEYNGKFMVNQMVLRGSSAFTPTGHSRLTYRNFFPTHARWQRTGLRLARDLL
jgi:ergothioneine biosynthesis protein EgtB